MLGVLGVLGGDAVFAQAPAPVSWSWDFAAVPWCDAAPMKSSGSCVAWITLNAGRTQNAELRPFAGAWAASSISGYPGLATGTPLFRYWRALAAGRPDASGRITEREIARSAPAGPRLRVTADPQTGAATHLNVEFDVASDPLCASATATDCVAQAVLTRAGVDVRVIAFSAFTVTSGIAGAQIAINSLPIGYGTQPLDFTAVLDARAVDGSLVRTAPADVTPFQLDARTPKGPRVIKN